MSVTFKEANQIRAALKMKLSNYSWYVASSTLCDQNDYYVVVHVKKVDNEVRKIIPPVFDGVSIRTELDKGP